MNKDSGKREKLYYRYIKNHYEVWRYDSKGKKVNIPDLHSIPAIQNYAAAHGYELVLFMES